MTEKKSALSRKISRREMLRLTALTGVGVAAAACAAPPTEAPKATEAPAPTEAPPPATMVHTRPSGPVTKSWPLRRRSAFA